MADDAHKIYDDITSAYEEWVQLQLHLPRGCHLLCPKIDDDDDEEYMTPGPPMTEVTAEQKEERKQNAQHRIELTYDVSLLLGISKETSGIWLDEFVARTESWLTKCDSCILHYHMHRRKFLKKLRE